MRAVRSDGDGKEDPNDDKYDDAGTESTGDFTSQQQQPSSWLLSLGLPLWLVYVSNQWSRFSIQSLVDFSPTLAAGGDSTRIITAMNVELNFNEAQYGILASVAFTSLFAVASVGAGYLSDRFRSRRKVLTVGSAAAWGAATLGMSFSQSFEQVVICRILTGLACAFSTPIAYTLLQQRVPAGQQALASSLYGTGVAVASALTALSIVLDNELGWRSTLLLIACTGFASALASLVLLPNDEEDPEVDDGRLNKKNLSKSLVSPTKSKVNAGTNESVSPSPSFLDEVQDVLVSSRRVQWIYLASLIRFGCGLTIGVWGAPYFRLAYPGSQEAYAVWQAAISAVGATVSGVIGGAAADWLSSTSPSGSAQSSDKGNEKKGQEELLGRRLWVPVLGSVLAAPAWYYAVHAHQNFEISMYWLALEYLVAECWFGPTISTLQASVRPGSGGTAQGIFTLTGAVGNLAPSLVGLLYASSTSMSDVSARTGAEALSGLLAVGVGLGYLASAACFAMASREPGSHSPERAKSKEA
jgi:MFS family permease